MIRNVIRNVPATQNLSGHRLPVVFVRTARYQAFDATFDPEELAEARKWYSSFREDSLPKGQITFSRSSGPGGQHVNKTETKATTVWSITELAKDIPKLMHPGLRASRYYTIRNDSISIQAQTQRSRTANSEENQQKLLEEIQRIYRETVPGETSDKTAKKYEAL
ncbi:peptidyl-tRNA hydrolase domain-containing protein [Xylariales sp. PMI_506]|nr:peptidyl-tRNA hydrolase domain-containing protein [Xylariales sp. PMI_506]